ncbi:MAG: bifunctional nuclease family protein [candidate division Zixibacteria bacterium]|nr:bifunctional nuclease family protein [candidate division Zixibacteria bacterium]MDD5426645.1 bifunctional nuclease family protein [candidate division Zixibacteria bacterium]
MKMVEVKIEGLALDMTTNTPVVILSPEGIDKVLPIWIGHAEAWVIAMELSGVGSKRPLTHDLIKKVITAFNARVDRVEITELREQTFFALIHLVNDNQTWKIDARPSDSIALALKTGSKIYVNEELFEIGKGASAQDFNMPTDPESLRERLRKINPEDFGKYSL